MSGRGNRIDKGHSALILKAIAKGGLSFVVQPIHDAQDIEAILYAECLARVTDAEGVVHTAGAFVPQLERLEGRFDLDLRMLELVLSALTADAALTLGCNLSAATLSAPDRFADIFNRISRQPELTSRLVVEVTETYPLVGAPVERLKMIRALGCRIAIDDFGTGYATPSHLLQVTADIVKIDASFIRDIRPGRDGHDSLYHLVGFASCLAPLVVVEGIETEAQLEAARSTGGTHAQGFLLSRPMALQQLPQMRKFGLREVG
ncbi:EAL domain-containing protein [Rhizobium sp. LEGMi198b]|uniref:EAL domain-containing protein n=1 Tax=unclassified Rhizobium TaxID=2613769 RepID=UPI000CF200F4|nr:MULTISPECIES: EAL domain-containing protein [Rhizobium]MDK4741039.1 EAL domain-containing protein [Rhizobium sp. CNPSo 3464]UWU21157.1 EAL domain-containing protein [Rhizobium tropici]WFU01962.1 EAL domain-containing protein [Rhizobium sp. CB3171]